MKAKIGKEPFDVFCYDLESHNDAGSIERGETGVWLSCFIDETSTPEDPKSFLPGIPELLERLERMTAPRKGPRFAIRSINGVLKCSPTLQVSKYPPNRSTTTACA